MNSLFQRYKDHSEWLVVEGLPDKKSVRLLMMYVSVYADAYNIQPRLGDSTLDVAFKNLHIVDETEEGS